jgi:very-short-patch-repair endonuclease
MTPAEVALWHHLRRNQHGFHFRRQPPLCGFYPDFACLDLRLVVEADGGVHESRIEYDAERTAVLESRGYVVIRFTNEEVLGNPRECAARIGGICYERAAALAHQKPAVARRLNELFAAPEW